MNTATNTILIDGQAVPIQPGDTVMSAATRAGIYIPHLCHDPRFTPHGNCKLCTVKVNGRNCAACTFPAEAGQVVQNDTEELNADRRAITQLLFVEGNHFCPSCEKSGNCQLQGVAYFLNMLNGRFPHFYPSRETDASHPDVMLDRDRCIFCELCVRASRELDGKDVFAIAGRGIHNRLIVNSPSGLLKDSNLEATDAAAQVCPVGAILIKRHGFEIPIGERMFDHKQIDAVTLERETSLAGEENHG